MMKKIVFVTCMGILLLLGSCRQQSYQEKFRKMAEQENASCPRRLNETTVMDSTRYDAERNIVHYYYTLSGAMDNITYMKENAAFHKNELRKAVNHLLETQEYLKHGTKFHIVYHSSNSGVKLAEFDF